MYLWVVLFQNANIGNKNDKMAKLGKK